MNEPVILYEVYPKRAIHQPYHTLPLLDRDRNRKKAKRSARAWGACVFRMECRILNEYPLQREVLNWSLIYIHKPTVAGDDQDTPTMTRKELMGKLRKPFSTAYKKRDI